MNQTDLSWGSLSKHGIWKAMTPTHVWGSSLSLLK